MADQEDKRVVELSDEELTDSGFWGDGALESVKSTIKTARANPELLGELTWFMLECQNLSDQQYALETPSSTTAVRHSSHLNIGSAHTVNPPHLVSEFERVHYWHGISTDPPELLYRSDLESNPFPVPPPGARWFQLPEKTAEGVFETPLNAVWHIVAPMIVALLKKRVINYSAINTARFSTRDEEGKKTLGPIVIWIATHPNTTSAENARDASPDILHILEDHNVHDAVVEWYEGSVEKLVGLALMPPVNQTDPTHYVRRVLTAAVGMPIATREMEEADAQGTLSFFFHENKTKHGEPSPRVFAVSNKHVLRADTTVDYKFMGAGAPRQYVRACGIRRFQRLVADIRVLVTKNIEEAVGLTNEIARLNEKRASGNWEHADEEEEEAFNTRLKKVNKDNDLLRMFFEEVNAQWHDIARRNIGFVDWAPRISFDIDERHYTRDIGTVELDPQKFKKNFQGNVVNLASKLTTYELNTMFWPNNINRTGIKIPFNRQLRIRGVVERKLLAVPDCYDENGNPVYIVGKDGNSSGFTVGRYSGLEAYTRDKSGKESIEVAVYNYSKESSNFSKKGDSGSLIFTGDGRMLAILHSGIARADSVHVTYGTPAWWVIEQLKVEYPYADFDRTTF